MNSFQRCLKAVLEGIEAVRNEPEMFHMSRMGSRGKQALGMFFIGTEEQEEALCTAIVNSLMQTGALKGVDE